MATGPAPMRRVVVGEDGAGRSRVLHDSHASNLRPDPAGRAGGMTEIWCLPELPVRLADGRDYGTPPFSLHPLQHGAFLRFVESLAAPPGYDPATDPHARPMHAPVVDAETGRGDRGGRQAGMSGMHKTRSVDYGFVASGARSLVVDDDERAMGPGDICVQLGNYHAWANRTGDSVMGYVMIGADFDA